MSLQAGEWQARSRQGRELHNHDQARAGRRIEVQKKKPRRLPGLDFDGDCYILGLQALPLASHIPPALVQSAFVFAVVTSAANVGAVNANASPKATIIESSFDIRTLLLVTRTTFVVALKSYWFLR